MNDQARIFEAKPPRSILERVVSGLSERGIEIGKPPGGIPELTPSDYAAAISGVPDAMASGLFFGGFLSNDKARGALIKRLHLWGWMRWAENERAPKIDILTHGRLCALAVFEHIHSDQTAKERERALKVSRTTFTKLVPHYHDLRDRLSQAESVLIRHLHQRLGGND